MKTNAFFYLAVIALLMCAVLNWSCRRNASTPKLSPLSRTELKEILEKSTSEPETQAEIDSLFSRFGDKDSKPLYGPVLSTPPGLMR